MGNLEPLNYLDDAMLEFSTLKARMSAYSYAYVWARWIRGVE